MAELLELVESMTYEDAASDPSRLFGREGVSVHNGIRTLQRLPDYRERLLRAAEFVVSVTRGRISSSRFAEAMTTSDFPLLFGDLLDRQILAAYQETPVTYPGYMATGTLPDFRLFNSYTIDGLTGLLQEVKETGEYKQSPLTEARRQWRLKKYGRGASMSWEAMINDRGRDLVTRIPQGFGIGARRTEEWFATSLFVGSGGPLNTVYTVGNGNIITGNPSLTITSLQAGLTQLYAQRDDAGQPIVIEMAHLVVPPALKIVAENILNAIQVVIQGSASGLGAGANMELWVNNWMRGGLALHVNSYLPVINTTNGNTNWFLFGSPTGWRPAAEVDKLLGYEEPQLFMKAPDAVLLSGGAGDAANFGSFQNDEKEWKVRHVVGGSIVEPRMTMSSEGDNT